MNLYWARLRTWKKNPIHVSNIAFNVDVNLKAIVTQSFIFPY